MTRAGRAAPYPTSPTLVDRRQILRAGAALPFLAGGIGPALAQAAKPDYRLVIAKLSLEIAPGHVVETVAYDGQVPGPLIRLPEGKLALIEVVNAAASEDIVHWHGLMIPSAMDGAMEEGSPMIMPGETLTYSFTPKPAGTRWYHSHAMAGKDLTKSLFSGQYGFFVIDPASDPGRYDQEVLIAMHHWEPEFVSLQDIRKGPPADNGLEVVYKSATFNGKALGHGEPIRVKEGQRVLFRLLNASATEDVMVALPGHRFTVVALDGNPVPTPQTLDVLMMAPAERIDAVVEMNRPGVWIFGATQEEMRTMGLGVVVEYAGATGAPEWQDAPKAMWDYTIFGRAGPASEPDERIELLFGKINGGRGGYNRWTINGKSWPDADPLIVQEGKRYRLIFHNLTGDMHPLHLHRHSFEITNFAGKPCAGVIKDVVDVPRRQTVEVDFTADNPGPSLLHCHMQEHQDFGFMTLVKYA